MKARLLLIACTLIFAAGAQQDPLNTLFWNNFSRFNPAATGLFYRHQGALMGRTQWVGVNGAPDTYWANYSMRMDSIHSGVGFHYEFDKIGITRQHTAMLDYSYQFQLKPGHMLSVGVSAGMVNVGWDNEWVPPTTLNDPSLPSARATTKFDANFGVMYKNKHLYAGLSTTHFTAPKHNTYSVARHYYLTAGYNIFLGHLVLQPRAIVRTEFIQYSADLNLVATYGERYWLGVGYRTSDAFLFMGGWDIAGKYRIGYAYDWGFNKLSTISRGSHEIVLAIQLE